MVGASKGTIAFSHANGFPAGTYRRLFEVWQQAGWRVIAVPSYGHDAAYPVSSNWPRLRDQLLDHVHTHAPGERVALVGHSLGGYLSLLAACRQPHSARCVVLIDSPIVTGWRAHSLHVAKLTGLIQRASPARVSRSRRHQWPSAEDAHRHFAAKSKFARWDAAVLRDYIACGVEPDEGGAGVRLSFRREVETRLYNTLPHHFSGLLQRHPPHCPVAFVGGRQSVEVHRAGMASTRALTQGRVEWLEGSHLVPMEKPVQTAAAVLRAIV